MEDNNFATNDLPQRGYLNIVAWIQKIWERRRVFYWVLPSTFVLSAALILCVPRYYNCDVVLAPEMQGASSSGSLQSLASSFGFDMNNMAGVDALYPMLYPDIVASPDFLVNLFDIQVATADGEYEGTYFDFLNKHYKYAFWKRWKFKLKGLITRPEKMPVVKGHTGTGVDIFCMNKTQWKVIDLMQDNIACKIDKKTEVITISVKAQDKVVCAVVADSVCRALQNFITDYRTIKNKKDLAYYEDVMQTAYEEYRQASAKYIHFADSHGSRTLEQYRIEAQNLEAEMQLKQSAYISFQKQYLATQAKLQENTPVFTIVQSATVPRKPAGPKRMFFVLAMLVLATGITACVIGKEYIIAMFA